MKMTEGRDSPCDNSEQTNLVHYMSDPSSDSCSHSELSDMESPSRLSPLEDEVNQESSSPFVQLKMKRMLEEAYFVPIPHDPSLSRMNSCPTAISNNGPSAFTKVKSSRDEINKTNTKHFNLIKLNQIKSVFAKSGSYSNTGSAGTSPVALGHTFALKKSFKKEAFHEKEQFFKNGIDPLGSSSRNSSPLQAKEELVDHESPVNSKSYKPLQTEPVDLSMNKKSSCAEFIQDVSISQMPDPLDIKMDLSSLSYPKTNYSAMRHAIPGLLLDILRVGEDFYGGEAD